MKRAALLLLLATVAFADDDRPLLQHMRFVEHGDDLTVTTKVGGVFDYPGFQALSSGFPSTVEIQTWVYPKDSNEVVAYTRIVRSVVYDLWDEVYTVRPCKECKAVTVKSPAEALTLLTSIDDWPIAKLADLPYEDVFQLAVRVDLNPVSKETLAEVRRWLSQGTGGGLDRGGVFFGSFVSVFVNPKIAEADRVIRLRSQPFFRPKP